MLLPLKDINIIGYSYHNHIKQEIFGNNIY